MGQAEIRKRVLQRLLQAVAQLHLLADIAVLRWTLAELSQTG